MKIMSSGEELKTENKRKKRITKSFRVMMSGAEYEAVKNNAQSVNLSMNIFFVRTAVGADLSALAKHSATARIIAVLRTLEEASQNLSEMSKAMHESSEAHDKLFESLREVIEIAKAKLRAQT
ncbi:MAG: hypothetical protein EOP04_02515 [Proteobacteria bacterium]|nr:MAG: hypothetical protein EOP04_02515 [Pseudomonadota bacterium]